MGTIVILWYKPVFILFLFINTLIIVQFLKLKVLVKAKKKDGHHADHCYINIYIYNNLIVNIDITKL